MNQYIEIIKELYRQTKARQISWEPTSVRNQYSIPLGMGAIQFDYYDEFDSMRVLGIESIYRVNFLNQRGETINTISIDKKIDPNYELFDNLWTEITNSYYQKVETIDSMLRALGLEE